MGNFVLTMAVRSLTNQINKLNRTDDDANKANKKLEKLEEIISDDIQSDSNSSVIERVQNLKDYSAASMSDEYINGAIAGINREIATIEAAINAQKQAANALSSGSGKHG